MSTEFRDNTESIGNYSNAIIELPRIDAEELREEMPDGQVSIENRPGSSSVAHDAMTVLAIVLLSKDILKVLATFIARYCKRNKKSFNFELTKPDGTKKTVTFYSDEIESSSNEKVIEKLEKLLGNQPNTGLPSGEIK